MDGTFLPLATGFVENAAVGLGLGQSRALALTLATEEIFSHLCRVASPDQWMEIVCTDGGYYVQADFRFSLEDFNMRAFNLTTTVSVDDEASLDEMGLLIASRTVERFQVHEKKGLGQGRTLTLALIKEKAYPVVADEPEHPARHLPAFSIRQPDAEEVKHFCVLVNQHYRRKLMPDFLNYPGKVADMVKSGAYRINVAVGPDGHIGGGIVRHWPSAKTVECFGPYLFNQQKDSPMAGQLLEACLGEIARSHAVGLINRFPTAELPEEHFEPLGRIDLFRPDGSHVSLNACFRQMHEDPGAAVWSHAALYDFLAAEYDRLALPREIRAVSDRGEAHAAFSVLSAEFDRSQNMATLRPIRPGLDAHDNIAAHLQLLSTEGIANIFFEMDLAQAWQADFTPALLSNGFAPRLVLPNAGEGDLAVFQRPAQPLEQPQELP
jgi:hypothetical protein